MTGSLTGLPQFGAGELIDRFPVLDTRQAETCDFELRLGHDGLWLPCRADPSRDRDKVFRSEIRHLHFSSPAESDKDGVTADVFKAFDRRARKGRESIEFAYFVDGDLLTQQPKQFADVVLVHAESPRAV